MLIAIGAIFTFAITAHPSFLNLQIAGLVVMATGVAGLLLPRRGQEGWLRRRTVLRKGARGPVVGHVDETRYPRYIMLNPGASATASEEPDHEGSSTIPDMRADSAPARVVSVASAGQEPIDFSDVMLERGYDGVRAYRPEPVALADLTQEAHR